MKLDFCRIGCWNLLFADERFARIAQFRSREELDVLRKPLEFSEIYMGPLGAVWVSLEGMIGKARDEPLCLCSCDKIHKSVSEVLSNLHCANQRQV